MYYNVAMAMYFLVYDSTTDVPALYESRQPQYKPCKCMGGVDSIRQQNKNSWKGNMSATIPSRSKSTQYRNMSSNYAGSFVASQLLTNYLQRHTNVGYQSKY